MAFSHSVPSGKVLRLKVGGYVFIGPCEASMSGNHVLPSTYTDGTSTSVQSIGPAKTVIDKMALSEEEVERASPSPSVLGKLQGRRKK